MAMDGPGDKFLAGSGFAEDEHAPASARQAGSAGTLRTWPGWRDDLGQRGIVARRHSGLVYLKSHLSNQVLAGAGIPRRCVVGRKHYAGKSVA